MRFRRLVAAVMGMAAIAATACTQQTQDGSPLNSEQQPAPPPAAEQTEKAYAGPRLHWDDGSNAIPKPANLRELREATLDINRHLAEQGFLHFSETVDNEKAPTVLLTKWLSSGGDIVVDVHSALGVQAITFKRDSGDVMAGTLWLRCPVTAKNGDYTRELDFLNQKNAEELMKSLCVAVGV